MEEASDQPNRVDGKIESTDQKHIMRYQQLFASLAIRKKLAEGIKSGVVWHTQGSGKTALSYYLTYILNDFYSKQNKVAKFYFIVDRLDLLEQATQEFEARGPYRKRPYPPRHPGREASTGRGRCARPRLRQEGRTACAGRPP